MDLSTLNAVQQGTLFTLLILGHAITVHGFTSFCRARTLRSVLKVNSNQKREMQTIINKTILRTQEVTDQKEQYTTVYDKLPSPLETHIIGTEIYAEIPSPDEPVSHNAQHFIVITNPSHDDQSQQPQFSHPRASGNLKTCLSWMTIRLRSVWPRIKNPKSWHSLIDTEEPRWIEYKALKLITVLTILYNILFLFVGMVSIGLWMTLCRPDIPRADGVSPPWAGAFLATSSFSNNGMSLIDANMAPFQHEYVSRDLHFAIQIVNLSLGRPTPLLICGFLILAGNTLFPCLLRLVIWTMRKTLPDKPGWRLWRRTCDLVLTQPQSVIPTSTVFLQDLD